MSKVVKSTIGLMIATILAKILGFVREIVLASTYGTSMYTDAYLTSMNVPLVIFAVVGTALGTTFVPLYFEIRNTKNEQEALIFTNNILNIVFIISLLIFIIGSIFIEPIVKIFGIGFNPETFKLCVKFSRVMMISVIFTGLSYIMSYYLQTNNNFVVPGLISLPRNIIIITSTVLSIKYGIMTMVWGSLVGIILEFIFQLPFAIKKGYRYKAYLSIKDEYVKRAGLLIMPVLISVSVNQLNTIVDRTLASTLPQGAISSLNYANKLNGFVMALFITSLVSVMYPTLSKLLSENNLDKFKESIVTSINSIILIIMPISVGAIVLSRPIVKLLFERGAFDDTATKMTSIALVMYSIGMVSFGIRDIMGRIFLSLQDTKTPMINGIICMVINIIINIILIKPLKYAGLALGTSIAGIASVLLLFKILKDKIGYFGQDKIIKNTFKSLIASVIMGLFVYLFYKTMFIALPVNSITQMIALLLSVTLGGVIYGGLIVMFKIEEVEFIVEALKSKIFKIKKSKN